MRSAPPAKAHKPKAVYLVPTLHNPTTVTLGSEHRKTIADIVGKHGLFLIEDDACGLLQPTVSPLANLIPERTYLAVGLLKCIAPALGVSYPVGARCRRGTADDEQS